MSYILEYKKMKPVLEMADKLSIASNSAPEALFEAGLCGFQIWCTPEDHPKGWDDVEMCRGAFSKPCDYVASVAWGWENDVVTHVEISTDAYALHDLDVKNGNWKPLSSYHNRDDDLEWATKKVRWLFEQATLPIPILRTHIEQVTYS